ncbi:type II toxin-antitoxin system VapC family toxin [Candidatus Desantisbacteria bacterium]|nr:type II toxin-antitoxin system VapC family toxin [Candidatus Desantisbacteria bacterium]
MSNILIDTNAFISILDKQDKWNKIRDDILKTLSEHKINIIITDIVLNEALNVLSKRFESKGKEKEFPELISKIKMDYKAEDIEWISERIKEFHNDILEMLTEYSGMLNYNDCFLLQYMIHDKLKYIISFDTDFDEISKIKRIYSVDSCKLIFRI